MEVGLALRLQGKGLSSCEHRTVAKDGRIVCSKIVIGDNEVTPDVCRTCPMKAVNCAHLRFSLKQIAPSRLVVRYNGREEVWNDDPPEVRFEQSACAARVMPIAHPRQCVGCALRQPVQAVVEVASTLMAPPSLVTANSSRMRHCAAGESWWGSNRGLRWKP